MEILNYIHVSLICFIICFCLFVHTHVLIVRYISPFDHGTTDIILYRHCCSKFKKYSFIFINFQYLLQLFFFKVLLWYYYYDGNIEVQIYL